MRTTVTIDPDTEILLKEEAGRTGKSFKKVLNEAIRSALAGSGRRDPIPVDPLFSRPFPPGLDDRSFNRLADDWDDEDTVHGISG